MWIESHQELREHPKTKRAARLLHISTVQLIGHLHFVWWRALDYAQDGNLAGYDDADIADWAGWEGSPDEFIQALNQCGVGGKAGFIEWRAETGSWWLHDWYEYAGKLIDDKKRRAAHARHVRAARPDKAGEPEDTSPSHDPHVTVTLPPTVPNLTVPNHTVPGESENLEAGGGVGELAKEPRAAEADAAPVGAGSSARPKPERVPKPPAPKFERIARVVDAFRALGLKDPRLPPRETRAIGVLLDAGFTAQQLAECWRDIKGAKYLPGDNFAQAQLSFEYLAGFNRMGNWQDWVEANRPPMEGGRGNGKAPTELSNNLPSAREVTARWGPD